MKILVLHGPNLKFLGTREPKFYGTLSLLEINRKIKTHCRGLKASAEIFQSDYEGRLIEIIYKYRHMADAIVINPAAYTHYSYALRDAIAACGLPAVEVHLSDIKKREAFRKKSVTAAACLKVFYGEGWKSYIKAIDFIYNRLNTKS